MLIEPSTESSRSCKGPVRQKLGLVTRAKDLCVPFKEGTPTKSKGIVIGTPTISAPATSEGEDEPVLRASDITLLQAIHSWWS